MVTVKPKGFVAMQSHLNLDTAREYCGDLIVLFPSTFNSLNVESLREKLNEALDLQGFDAESDYLILVGKVVHTALILAFMLDRYQKVNVLMFHGTHSRYVPRTIYSKDSLENAATIGEPTISDD